MSIVILEFEPTIQQMLQMILEVEGYTVTSSQAAAEAMRAIEAAGESCVLFADNFHVNPEAQQAFTMLRDRPQLRQRVWVVGMVVFPEPARQLIANGLMDEHLGMPFTVDQVLAIVTAHTSRPSG